MTTWITALADARGNLADFRPAPGAVVLVEGRLLVGRAFDAGWLRDALAGDGIEAIIPPRQPPLPGCV